MKRYLAGTALTVLLISMLMFYIGCAKQSTPFNPESFGIHLDAIVQTPGVAQAVIVHNDTAYVADNEMGIARIKVTGTPTLITPNLNPGGASYGFIWVSYDSVRQRVIGADRMSSTSRLTYKIYEAKLDTMRYMFEMKNTPSILYFHDASQATHVYKCHQFGDGCNIYNASFQPDTSTGDSTWSLASPNPGYNPPTLSVVHQSVWTMPYTYCAAGEYGVVQLYQPSYTVAPVERKRVDIPGVANAICKANDYLYVSSEFASFSVVRIQSDTLAFVRNVSMPNASKLQQVLTSSDNSMLFVIDYYDGVYCFSLANPAEPLYMGLLPSQRTQGAFSQNKTLYVCDEVYGLLIYRW